MPITGKEIGIAQARGCMSLQNSPTRTVAFGVVRGSITTYMSKLSYEPSSAVAQRQENLDRNFGDTVP